MAGEIETGGLAFPFNDIGGDCDPGMTLRDYFAAKAMGGLIQVYWSQVNDYESADELLKCMAENAFETADAMIKARG